MSRVYWLFLGLCMCVLGLGCGEADDGSVSDAAMSSSNTGGGGQTCFTTYECSTGQYCRADDPATTAEGSCQPMEPEDGPCVAGLDCRPGLFCKKTRGEIRGLCMVFPPECGDMPGCMCAMEVCGQIAGASCSLSTPDNPGDTMVVVCPD